MRRRAFLVLALGLGAVIPAQAAAQIRLLGATGLGRRVTALDARARGMGGVGVALHGGNLSALNPAAAAHFTASGIWVTFMPERRTVKGEVASGRFSTEDVPIIRLVFPFKERWAIAISAGSYLDQDWGVEFVDTLRFSTGDVSFKETRTSDGGVTQFRAELGGVIGEGWSLGAAVLFYSGEARRKVDRVFEMGSGFTGYSAASAVDYKGWGLALGTEFQPIPEMILGLVGSWGTGLDISSDTTGQELDVDLPFTLDIGGSWQLTPDFLVALALGWEGWSRVGDDLPGATASDIWRLAGGVELTAAKNQSSRLLVRAGGHAERLPFNVRGGPVWERAVSFGVGALLRGGRGRLDTAIELGRRGSVAKNDLEESFVRFSLGLAVFAR
jgi:hypothetical protein